MWVSNHILKEEEKRMAFNLLGWTRTDNNQQPLSISLVDSFTTLLFPNQFMSTGMWLMAYVCDICKY